MHAYIHTYVQTISVCIYIYIYIYYFKGPGDPLGALIGLLAAGAVLISMHSSSFGGRRELCFGIRRVNPMPLPVHF